jgi:RNA polymerase sigma factor (sigma-70 family)
MSAKLVRLAARAGLLPARAADMVQSLWLRFCKKFPGFTEENVREHHRAWLRKVVQHRIADALRAKHRLRTCSLDALKEEPQNRHEQSSANRARDDARSFEFRRWLDELRQSDPRACELIWLHHVEGVGLAELAKMTGREAHWISVRINRALIKFRIWRRKHQNDGEESS